MQANVLVYALIVATVINGLLAYFTWKRRGSNASIELFILLCLVTAWSFFAIFEAAFTTVSSKTVFSVLTYPGISSTPVMFLLFACRYVHIDKWIKKKNVVLLFVIPAATVALAATNSTHGLLWPEITTSISNVAGIYGVYAHGIWFWVNAIYSYSLMLIAIIILVINMLRYRSIYLLQSRILIFSSLVPFAANLAYSLSPRTIIGTDITPMFFTFSGLLLFFGLHYYKLLNLSPVAWEKIIEDLDDGVILFNREGRVVDVNRAFGEILSLENIKIGQEKKNLLGGIPELNQYISSKPGKQKKEIVINIGGKKCFLEIFFWDLYDRKNKNIIGQTLLVRDLTEKKLAEGKLVTAMKAAEAASIAKSSFLANMSHEIRTPMNSIFGFLQLLEKTELNQEQKRFIGNVSTSTENLLEIINDILDISRIEAGKMALEEKDFNLHHTIEKAVIPFTAKASEKGIELNFFIDSDVPVIVKGDPVRLRQVLNNLISNAIKFTEKGNVLMEVFLKGSSGNIIAVEFEIKDTGIGIKPELVKGLFRPFVQADTSSTKKYGGTGLGLSICKNLINMMGGTISVKSQPGKGSIFIFSVNMKEADNDAYKKDLEGQDDYSVLKGSKILIVDDNEMNREIARRYLEEKGSIVFEANGGPEALIMITGKDKNAVPGIEKSNAIEAEGTYFDAILIDYQMPVINGKALGEEIKKIPAKKDTPLILVTSVASSIDNNIKNWRSFSGFITKPYKRIDLLDCARNCLGKKVKKGDEPVSASAQVENKNPGKTVTPSADIENAEIKPPAHDSVYRKPFGILLVEDNEVNRLLFTEILKSDGISCDIAVNGKEAVALFSKKKYNLVFMDCQMPVMDGIAATKKIRELEGKKKHAIIIAMTAFASIEDERKCLAAGMDGFLSKPVAVEKVREIIRWATGGSGHANININSVFEKTGRDTDFLKSLTESFRKSSQNSISEIRSALKARDAQKLRFLSHSLKGTLYVLEATRAFQLAENLESLCGENDFSNMENIIDELEKETENIINTYDIFIAKNLIVKPDKKV
jgi:PAS domain S-box-containing protein